MGDDLQDLPVLRRAGFSAAPADAAPEVRAARAVGQRERRRARRGARVHRARAARAGRVGRRPSPILRVLMSTARLLLVGLVALLAGLAVGKAWERYKLQDGVWIDRRRARESPHYMLGLNFLVASQIDQAIDELTKAARRGRRSARDSPHPRQPLSREGPGRPRDPGAPGPAAAAEAAEAGARQRAALPRPRLPQRRLRRSRDRGLQRSPEARSRQPLRAVEPREAATRISTSGTEAYATRQKLAALSTARTAARLAAAQRGPRVPRERVRPGGAAAAATTRKPRAASTPRSSATRATCRRT